MLKSMLKKFFGQSKIRIAINGFGRIGRLTTRRILEEHPEVKIIAINDLTQPKTLAYLFQNDSSFGHFPVKMEVGSDYFKINNEEIKIFAEKDPSQLPWQELKIDVVLECTGRFTKYEDAQKHLQAGAKRVIISAPTKSPEIKTYLLGVNEDKFNQFKDKIISMGSCTTNCLAPVLKIINQKFGIEKGFFTTIHSYTNAQTLLDLPNQKDVRRGRAAALNIIPTTTGAAIATTKVLPELVSRIDGVAIRVPTPVVSLTDITLLLSQNTSTEEINKTLAEAAQEKMKGILDYTEEPLVSIDYKGNSHSSIVDGTMTKVNQNLVKLMAWYDNEYGYSSRLAEMASFIGKK